MVIVFCCASQLVHSAPGKGRVPPPKGKKQFGVWLVGKKLVSRNGDSNVFVLTQKQVSRVLNSRMYTRYPSKKTGCLKQNLKKNTRQRWFMSIIFGGIDSFQAASDILKSIICSDSVAVTISELATFIPHM